jgi:membrane protease YdiL (CAAX protease family)
MRDSIRAHPVAWFFVIAYALSWVAWSPQVLAGLGLLAWRPSRYLHLLGSLGPMCAAVFVTYASGDAAAMRRLRSRSLVLRGRGLWVAIAFVVPALLFLVSLIPALISNPTQVKWAHLGLSTEYPALPRPLFWLANVVCYGFGEEVGWRGFALPRMQSQRYALASALLLGIAWAGWHFPLFAFSPGLSSLGVAGSVGLLMSILTGSVLMAWLFNSSGGSVLVAAIFHGVLDVFMTSPVVPEVPMFMGATLTVGTISLVPLLGPVDLARRRRTVEP